MRKKKMRSAWLSLGFVILAVASCDRPRLSEPGGADGGADAGGDGTGATSDGRSPALALELLAGGIGGPGNADGAGIDAHFGAPTGVAVDSAGNLYVADTGNHTIRKVAPTGVVTTLAGTAGMDGSADGTGAAARFSSPTGIAVDSAGNVYVADQSNSTIRKLTPTGIVTTLAGTSRSGSADGTGAAASFDHPSGVAVDSSGLERSSRSTDLRRRDTV